MTEVSFYILSSQSQQERLLFACKLLEKAYRSDSFCYVLTDSAEQSQQLDDLLWTFRAGSFIPHHIHTGNEPLIDRAILIGLLPPPENWRHTVLNLSSNIPQNFQECERILEILDNSEDTKRLGRQRYREYQQANIPITTHKIGAE